ncbi:MAG: hypothetical protein ABJG68_03065 [Crocinitomicaceae bacterium]
MKTIKQVLSILFVSMVSFLAVGQKGLEHSIYFDAGFGAGKFGGVQMNFNYIWDNNVSGHFGYNSGSEKSEYIPKDYSMGVVGSTLNFLTFNTAEPKDYLNNVSIGIGKVIPLNDNNTVRFHPKISVTRSAYTYTSDWKKKENKELLFANYTYSHETKIKAAMILRPSIEFPFSRAFGLFIDPQIYIGHGKTQASCYFGIQLGLLNDQKLKHANL